MSSSKQQRLIAIESRFRFGGPVLPSHHRLPAARSLAFLLCCTFIISLLSQQSFVFAADAGSKKSGKAATQSKIKSAQKKSVSGKSSSSKKQVAASKATSSSRKKAYKRASIASYSYDYKSCVIFSEKNKKVIFTRSADRKIPPASLTKILSMYVAEDAIRNRKINRNAKVTVSPKAAAAGGSRMGLHAGDKVSLNDLLRGMAVASGNDASIAVAEFIGGSEQNFVKLMNKKARTIGMKRSTFKNANGLPAPGQYTTARDMLTLAQSYLASYPGNLDKYHSKSVHVYKSKYSCNANPLLGVFEGADGLKTGFVSASGYNIIATAKRGKQRYIGVILGAPTSAVRAQQARTLMEACFTRPSAFAANDSDINTKTAAGNKNSASATKAASTAKTSKKAAASSKSASSKKHAVKPGGKSKSAATRQNPKAVMKRTADKAERSPKRTPKQDSSQKQLPKGQPLVLMSYS